MPGNWWFWSTHASLSNLEDLWSVFPDLSWPELSDCLPALPSQFQPSLYEHYHEISPSFASLSSCPAQHCPLQLSPPWAAALSTRVPHCPSLLRREIGISFLILAGHCHDLPAGCEIVQICWWGGCRKPNSSTSAAAPWYCTQNLNLRNTCILFLLVKRSVSVPQTTLICLTS